jgi:hypothetical protein
VALATVQINGKDDAIHTEIVDAKSVFEAASIAMHGWSFLWWYDGNALVTVSFGDKQWVVNQVAVRTWKHKARIKKAEA